jgi:hypothetical protein
MSLILPLRSIGHSDNMRIKAFSTRMGPRASVFLEALKRRFQSCKGQAELKIFVSDHRERDLNPKFLCWGSIFPVVQS